MREPTGRDAFLLGPAVPSCLGSTAARSHLRLSPGRLELVRSARRRRTFDVDGGSLHPLRGRRGAELVLRDRDGGSVCTFDPVQWCVAPPANVGGAIPPHARRWREQLGGRIARTLDIAWSADVPADARGATRLLPGAGTAARRHVVTSFVLAVVTAVGWVMGFAWLHDGLGGVMRRGQLLLVVGAAAFLVLVAIAARPSTVARSWTLPWQLSGAGPHRRARLAVLDEPCPLLAVITPEGTALLLPMGAGPGDVTDVQQVRHQDRWLLVSHGSPLAAVDGAWFGERSSVRRVLATTGTSRGSPRDDDVRTPTPDPWGALPGNASRYTAVGLAMIGAFALLGFLADDVPRLAVALMVASLCCALAYFGLSFRRTSP